MFNQRFTVTGSSLKLLKIGERGVITALKGVDDTVSRKLQTLGVLPGSSIRLEQRFPRFVVNTSKGNVALDDRMIQSIYVRVVDGRTG